MNTGHLLTDAARHHPDREAFAWDGDSRSYAEANARADAIGAALQELGVRRGDRVATLMANGPELLETMFGAWKAGACLVPMNSRYTQDEVAYHVGDSRAEVLVVGEELAELVLGMPDRLPSVRHVLVAGLAPAGGERLESGIEAHAGSRPVDPGVGDDDVAWLLYTSGTTGRPKGAMLTHGNLTFISVSFLGDVMPVEPEDVGIHTAPLTHGAGFTALTLTMKAARQLIYGRGGFDPGEFLRAVEEERVAHAWLVPTQIKMVLRHPDLGRRDLSSLKRIVYGGAPMYVEDLKEAVRRIGPVFVQLWAQSETAMTGTYLRPEEHVLDGPASQRLGSCGHARSGVEVRLVDTDGRVVDEPGKPGELCVRAPSVMKGYWERPEETADTIRDGWLHTGDVASADGQGYYFLLDRTKDMVISGGLNVYPREVEEVLLRHPAVAQACVFGVPDDHWGEAVKAVVVAEPSAAVTEAEIIAFAAGHLAGYKKPKSVDFADDLPKSSYGKVLKRELRARYWAGHERMVN